MNAGVIYCNYNHWTFRISHMLSGGRMKSLIDKHGRKKVARVVFCVLTVLLLVEGAIIYAAYITVQYGDAILKLVKRSDTSLTLIDMEGRTLTAEFSSLDHEYEMNEFSFYCAITYLNQTISCSSDLFDVSVDIYTFSDGSELELTPGRTIDKLTFGNYNKGIKHAKSPFDWLSANAANVQSFLSDKLSGFTFTYSAFYQLFSLVKEVTTADWAKKVAVDLPVLFIAGKEDPVGNYGKGVEQSYRLLAEQGVKDLILQLYEGMRHEVLNEKNNLQVYEFVKMWMEKRI